MFVTPHSLNLKILKTALLKKKEDEEYAW